MSARVIATNAVWSALCQVLTRGSLILASLLLARHAETSAFAAYSYFQLTVSMLAVYAAMGLGVSASRFFAQAGSTGPGESVPLVGTLWALSVVLSLAAFLVTISIPSGILNGGLNVPRWLLALGVLVLALQIVPDGAILGLEKYRQASAIAAVAGGVTLAGAVIAIRVQDVRVAMGALIASSLVQSSAESLLVIRLVQWRRIAEGYPLKAVHIKSVLGFSGPMFVVSLMSASGGWLMGRLILGGPGGEHEFALFTIGLQWFALALFVPGVVSRVLLPRLVRTAVHGAGATDSRRLVRAGVVIATGAALTIAAGGMIFNPWLRTLYGERYQGDGYTIASFLGAAVVSAPANTLGNALVAKSGQWLWLALTIAWFLSLLAAGYAFRGLGGWSGGVAYAIAYSCLSGVAFVTARRYALV